MANKKISQLTEINYPDLTGLSVVVDNDTTQKITLRNLRQVLVDSGSHYFTGSQSINGNVYHTGSIIFDNDARIVPNLYTIGSIDLIAGHTGYIELSSHNTQSFIWVDDDGAYVGTDWDVAGNQWTFGHDSIFRSFDIFPNNTSAHDLGSDTLKWRNIYALGLSGPLSVTGSLNIETVSEKFSIDGGFGATKNFDFTSGSIFYLTGLTSNGTWNIVNVPEVNNNVTTFTFMVVQGITPYSGSQYQINDSNVTVKWVDAIIPSGSANKTDAINLSAFRVNSTWDVYGTLISLG